ncbi:c-type cytochrome [Phenylobacterium montanum]|uniref:C-type cytochrome n=1 Tax=Phenylobacterium montanum TaxID=2823693 RepID=A0A975G1E2_9CAUL|nr:c-type cytochrome [Caulobacter sp. S6]QUD88196.1 c-type cytochrome [Caulobacter sp. S6]
MKPIWPAAVGLAAMALAAFAAAETASGDWLYPAGVRGAAAKADAKALRRLPGSKAGFTDAQLGDLGHAVDWRPAEHPPMPPAVAEGQGPAGACGYCHLPDGAGRPENASLAGLPADYIRRQVADFASGARAKGSAFRPIQLMTDTAQGVDPKAAAQAADYYSRLKFTAHVRVVEADRIPPFVAEHFVYGFGKGTRVPLGQRILEGPDSMQRFELRDSHVGFVAYVPKGAIARGAALAAPCSACHGVGLKGGLGPPLAGRSPTYIARQLFAFRTGTRSNPEAAPMRATAGGLNDTQIIDLAAYAGSLRP